MDPLTIASAGAGVIGGVAQGLMQRSSAREQMRFQERMSSTSHQREVADLRAAGLNPVLSASGGPGASSPGGAQAEIPNPVGDSVHSALAARRLREEIKNMAAQRRNVNQDTTNKEFQGRGLELGLTAKGWQQELFEVLQRMTQPRRTFDAISGVPSAARAWREHINRPGPRTSQRQVDRLVRKAQERRGARKAPPLRNLPSQWTR